MQDTRFPYLIHEDNRQKYAAIMSDFWAYLKVTFENDNSDRCWSETVLRADELLKKYNDPFLSKLVMAYLDYQSSRVKQMSEIRKITDMPRGAA